LGHNGLPYHTVRAPEAPRPSPGAMAPRRVGCPVAARGRSAFLRHRRRIMGGPTAPAAHRDPPRVSGPTFPGGCYVASENVLNVFGADFEAQVLGSEQPVLVDFWAAWCAPCKAIAPALDALADAYEGNVRVANVNVEENQGVPQQFGIRSLPTLLMFKDGKVIDQLVGAVPRSKLEEAIKKAL